MQLLVFAPHEKWLAGAPTFELEMVAFASRAGFFPDEDAFRAGQAELFGAHVPGGKPLCLGSRAFLPGGLFQRNDARMMRRASALLTGTVTSARRLRPAGGATFWHVRVDSYPGAIDVVADPEVVIGEPAVGAIAAVNAWLVGRPSEAC